MRWIVINRSDGGVTIRTMVSNDFDPEREVASWAAKDKIKERGWTAVSWFVTDVNPNPEDRDFRDAFVVTGQRVRVSMPRARTAHMKRIRETRNEDLAKLDKLFDRAIAQFLKTGNDADKAIALEVEAQKQKLRDIPQAFDLSKCKTCKDLREAWPDDLDAAPQAKYLEEHEAKQARLRKARFEIEVVRPSLKAIRRQNKKRFRRGEPLIRPKPSKTEES